MSTRVVIDDQIFTEQQFGGVSRYFTELVRAYRAMPELGLDLVTPYRWVRNEHLLALDPKRFHRPALPARLMRGRVLRTINAPRRIAADTGDAVVHHTYYFPEALRMPARARVCTIYDMIPEAMPELFAGNNPHQAKRRFVDECDVVLCISDSTRQDLLHYFGPIDKPVLVTHLGVTPEFFEADAKLDREHPYVLFVGQRFDYKNFDVLLRAFAHLAAEQPDLRLVCAGGSDFDAAELARIDELGLTGRVVKERVPDTELPQLYAAAECFVFPSRYEGFGLPIVEAFAAGCPVVLADMPCSVEIGGSAAQFFSPDDDHMLAEIVSRLVTDPAERSKWVDAGRLRAQDFSWARTAAATRDGYLSALEAGS